MAKNVSALLQTVGAYVDQSTTLPTGDELLTRISYLDQAQEEWATSYDWDALKVPYTVGASGASVGLPDNFRKFKNTPYDTTNNAEYPVIPASDRFTRETDDKYVCLLGNDVTGKYLVINPTSTATLSFDYLSAPTALASTYDETACPSPKFIAERAIAYVLESRSDPRFPQVKADAQRTLNNMITDQDTIMAQKVPTFMSNYPAIGD